MIYEEPEIHVLFSKEKTISEVQPHDNSHLGMSTQEFRAASINTLKEIKKIIHEQMKI